MQTEIHTAKSLVPQLHACKFDIAVQKLRQYKLPHTDKITAEIIQAEHGPLCSEVHTSMSNVT
jgi:hypothetical protein